MKTALKISITLLLISTILVGLAYLIPYMVINYLDQQSMIDTTLQSLNQEYELLYSKNHPHDQAK